MTNKLTNKEAIKRIHRFVETYKICGKDNYNPTTNITKLDYEAFKTAIDSLEQQKVGKWIINKEYNGYETIIKDCKCPFCNEEALLKKSYSMDGQSIVLYPSNYCSNCGAKLEVEK